MDHQLRHQQQGDPSLPGELKSFWIDTSTSTNYPSLNKSLTVDAVVIGAGIFGITTALFLTEAGLKVALIDAKKIASSVTGHTTAKITSLHTLIYDYLISQFGEEKARIHAQASQKAIDRIEKIIQENNIDCDFIRTSAYTFAQKPEEVSKIEKEVEAALKLGLPANFEDSIPIPLKSFGAVKFSNQAQFHPRKYLLPLVDKIYRKNGLVFENTKALSFTQGSPCVVKTDKGEIKAKDIKN